MEQRVVEIVDDLESYWSSVPEKMRETRDVFRNGLLYAKKPENHAKDSSEG